MNDDELERLLASAFDARSRDAVSDHGVPPRPRFAEPRVHAPRRHRALKTFASVAAAAMIVALVAVLSSVLGGTRHPAPLAAGPSSHTGANTAGSAAATSPSVPAVGKAIRVTAMHVPSAAVGVGMPVVAYFSRRFTDARPWQAATHVFVDGKPVAARWYFDTGPAGTPVEGHLRMRTFWPAHAEVTVDLAARGLSAGAGYAFADGLHLHFRTGARRVAVVSDSTHRLTLTQDGRTVGSYPVSLGSSATPTMRGTKVVMAQGTPLCMSGPGYHECGIRYTQKLTSTGEYLLAAPWNVTNIEHGIDTSNGCTNLLPKDARILYRTLRFGDVVEYPDADGPLMSLHLGFGDWDVPWSQWRTGGLIPTR